MLGFLNRAPNYGYELKKLYDNFFGQEKPILAGQVYSSLSRLERDDKIKELHLNTDAESEGPDRIKYQITPTGQIAFYEWLRTPEKVNPYLQTTLYYKVVLALINGAEVLLTGRRWMNFWIFSGMLILRGCAN